MTDGSATPPELIMNQASGKVSVATGKYVKSYDFKIKIITEALANRGENQIIVEGIKATV